MAAINQRDYVSAQTVLDKSLELFRASGDRMGASLPLFTLGDVAYLQTNYAEAQRLYKESLTLRRKVGDKRGVAAALASIANVCVKLGDHETAQTLYRESLALYSELDNPHGIVRAIAGLPRASISYKGSYTWRLRCSAWQRANCWHSTAVSIYQKRQIKSRHLLSSAVNWMKRNFNCSWENGGKLSMEQAISLTCQPATSVVV